MAKDITAEPAHTADLRSIFRGCFTKGDRGEGFRVICRVQGLRFRKRDMSKMKGVLNGNLVEKPWSTRRTKTVADSNHLQ